MCKQISSILFKNEITHKLFTYKYVYLIKCLQTNDYCYIVTITLEYLKPFNSMQKQNELSLILKCYPQYVFTNHIYLIYIYMYK